MEAGLDDGFAFASTDLWRPSLFTADSHQEPNIFPLLDTDLSPLKLDNDNAESKNLSFDLHIPELDTISGHILDDVETPQLSDASSASEQDQSSNEGHDIWDLDLDLDSSQRHAQLYTWEAFESNRQKGSRAAYLSEAGSGAFDAAVRKYSIDCTTIKPEGVLTSDVLLRSLAYLGLGRESIFFQWNSKKGTFVQSLEHIIVSGHTATISESLITSFMHAGARARQLAEYSEYSKSVCAARVALKRAIASILSTLDADVTARQTSVRSLLQLQSILERPWQITAQLQAMVTATSISTTNAETAAQVYAFVQQHLPGTGPSAALLQLVLAQVCTPWLESVCENVGISDRKTYIDPKSSVLNEIEVTDFEVSIDDTSRRTHRVPSFISLEDFEMIEETARGMAILRANVPEHPLVQPAMWSIRPPRVTSSDSLPELDRTVEDARRYEADLSKAIAQYSGNPHHRRTFESTLTVQQTLNYESLAWSEIEHVQHGYLENLGAVFDACPGLSSGVLSDDLQILVTKSLEVGSDQETDEYALISSTSFDPMELLRPLLQTQSRLVNATLMRHILRNVELRKHLDVQYLYHLFGNGSFVSHMAAALFDGDLQTAERKLGVMPSSRVMGLRLDARSGLKWPPASSELRLTLTGLIADSYSLGHRASGTPTELPGGLSFAIRELSDAEIDRVKNADSVYALDFLRLQYAPPKPLDTILTPRAMQQYDDVFRFLLKIVRLEHVTVQLQRCSQGLDAAATTRPATRRSLMEARHVISVLMSHFMDVGIGAPWRQLRHALNDVEAAIRSEDETGQMGSRLTLGFAGLRTLHNGFLERIRTRLFLRRRQDELRVAVETVFESVLQIAVALHTESRADEDDKVSRFTVATTGLYKQLLVATARPLKRYGVEEEDDEAMKMLLCRLDMNGFYSARTCEGVT